MSMNFSQLFSHRPWARPGRKHPIISSRPLKKGRGRHKRRALEVEMLEGRVVPAGPLVSFVLGGTQDTIISGTVYYDLNSDGVRNPGEDGVPGWTVYLDLDNSGTLNTDMVGDTEPSAITNIDGDYSINRLRPLTYRVAEVVQSGWTPTSPVSQDVTIITDTDTRVDFFNFSGGDIVGTVWNDLNADGVRAPAEPGLANWTVFLDLNDNLMLDPTEPMTLTNASGAYSFINLPEGDYEVTEILPSGWEVSPTFDIRQTATVVARTQVVQDYANFSLLNGSLRGTIWNDLNADGVRATHPVTGAFTEPGLAGWTVFLDSNNNQVPDPSEPTTLTNASGAYAFINLLANDYEVTEVLPSGWNVSPTFDIRQTVAVVGGMESVARDFANFTVLNGSIRGTVWNDLNRNGIRDVSLSGVFTDPGLPNWTVFLDLNRNRVLDPSEPSTLTGANGGYTFVGLQVGDYEVQEILPTGWEVATTFSDSQTVTVFSGVESIARDFANFNLAAATPGSVSGTVWNDLNGNGIRNPGEDGLPGWTVFRDLNSNGILDAMEPSVVSAADGLYSFTGVLPGSVTIVEQAMTGWRATAPPTRIRTITLRNAENATGLDFGNQILSDSAIRGVVFADSDSDGVRDAGERGLDGITVYLDLNTNGTLDTGEPQTVTSADLFFTPTIDEAGTYSFTHLAAGTYTVRAIVPATLSATPAAQLVHVITLTAAEDRSGVDTAAVFRPNEIHGIAFNDLNGNHQRDPGEPGVAGRTVFLDLDRDEILDPGEPTTTTLADGSFSFTNLAPGAYVVREVLTPEYEHTFPTTTGGILWPTGVSNPAVGNVNPLSITTSLAENESYRQTVSVTLPGAGAITNLVDVFLLFDDTGSFVNNSPIVRAAFPSIISQLQAALPGTDLGFGVGRLEEYANFASEYATGRPFVLNQPIVAASTTGYLAAIQAALNRTAPGYGGDQPETDIEALYQLVTGLGFDGNNNGSVLDSGPAGLVATQLTPGSSGDVPPFASFRPDPTGSVLPAAGNIGGGGFRTGALPIILLATDTGFAYQPRGETTVTGVGGLTLPISALTQTSRPTTPFNSGAGFQQTITGLNALGALVIGLGTNPQRTLDPRQGLESISKLTGAINRSTATIPNGTPTPIAPGDPLYFQIASGFASSVASGVVNAIQNGVTTVAVDITVQASDPRVRIVNHTGVRAGVGAGQTATFDIEFIGDGIPHRFDLQFVRAGTDVVLGSIPVVLGTPIPGDGYEFEDLPEGEIELSSDFGSRLASVPAPPTVTRFLSTSTGFTADFSRAVDFASLNLYDTQTGGLGAADVTVVDASMNVVRGSLVASSGQSITFLRTGGVLMPGTYTVTLRSASNGFKAASNGDLLDGDGDGTAGGDLVRTFTVAPSSAVVVSLPDVVRGPGQTINVPTTGTGMSLRLSDGTGVRSVTLTIRYNPALLNLTGASVAPGLPGDATVTLNTSTPGTALLTFNSPTTALSSGAIDLVRLTTSVPNAAPYTAKHLLDLDLVQINSGAIAALDDDAIHVVAYLGDASGSAGYSSTDATRALRVAVGLDGGFLATQLADPVLLTDVNGDGRVTATDALRILQVSVGMDRSEIPALPGVIPPIVPGGPDPFLNLPTHFTGRPGDVVTVPVNLDLSDGLEAVDLAFAYDTTRLELVSAADVRRGSLTADFDLFLANLNPEAGTIQVGLGRSAGPMDGRGNGSVLEISFRIKDTAPAGGAVLNLLETLKPTTTQLNEGSLVLNPATSNAAGDVLDGLITVQGADLPTVQRVVIKGSGQRSRVTRVTVTFSTVVSFQGNPADAFRLMGPHGPVRHKAIVALDETGQHTVVRLLFAGRAVERGSLADGRYILTIDGDRIVDTSGVQVDGDGDGMPGGTAVEAFYRLYGDSDGDGDVAFNRFRRRMGNSI